MEDASKGVPVGHMSSGNNVGRDCTSRCRSRACAAKSVVENVRLSVSQSSQSHAGSCHKGFEKVWRICLSLHVLPCLITAVYTFHCLPNCYTHSHHTNKVHANTCKHATGASASREHTMKPSPLRPRQRSRQQAQRHNAPSRND